MRPRELAEALPELRIGLVHGRMPPAEKDAAMSAFKASRIDLLVATTVVEVGVDVPDASLMIIENAERLGLAQLHQLRGRVGRGARRSACVMMYDAPLGETARARLAVLRADHRRIRDSRSATWRSVGRERSSGTRQTGLAQLRIADLAQRLPAASRRRASGPPSCSRGTNPASNRSCAAGSARERSMVRCEREM